MIGAVDVARCPEHGLHGERDECFMCGRPVEKVRMVPVAEVEAYVRDLPHTDAWQFANMIAHKFGAPR